LQTNQIIDKFEQGQLFEVTPALDDQVRVSEEVVIRTLSQFLKAWTLPCPLSEQLTAFLSATMPSRHISPCFEKLRTEETPRISKFPVVSETLDHNHAT
jgi:hypothetical protein